MDGFRIRIMSRDHYHFTADGTRPVCDPDYVGGLHLTDKWRKVTCPECLQARLKQLQADQRAHVHSIAAAVLSALIEAGGQPELGQDLTEHLEAALAATERGDDN